MISESAGAAAAREDRIPFYVIGAFGSIGLPLAALLILFGIYLPRFFVALGIPFAAVGAAVAIVRLMDVTVDPLIGFFMDRTRTAFGRFKPWLLACAPVLMIGVYMLTTASAGVGLVYLVFWLLVTFAGYSVLALGTAAWGAVLAPSYHERSRLYGWAQGIAVTGSVLLLLLPVFTRGAVVPGRLESMPVIGWIMAIAIPVTVAICLLAVPERSTLSSERPKFRLADYRTALFRPSMARIAIADLALTLGPATTAPIYVYFFKDVKGFSVAETGFLLVFYIAAGIVGAPFWGRVARRFGKHGTMQTASVAYAICQSTLMILPRVWPHHTPADALPTAAAMFAVGFCASAFLLLTRAMVADVVDEVRLECGRNLTSQLYAVVTTIEKIAGALSVSIIFPILQMVGYDGRENAVNTPRAIFGLEMCYLFAPIMLVLIGGATYIGYGLNSKRHADIRLALEERDSAAALETIAGPLPESGEPIGDASWTG